MYHTPKKIYLYILNSDKQITNTPVFVENNLYLIYINKIMFVVLTNWC